MICNYCGATLPPDSTFCDRCGQKVETVSPQPQQPQMQYQQPQMQQPQMQYQQPQMQQPQMQYQQPQMQQPQMQYQQPQMQYQQMQMQQMPGQPKKSKAPLVVIIICAAVTSLLLLGTVIYFVLDKGADKNTEADADWEEEEKKDTKKKSDKKKDAEPEEDKEEEEEESKEDDSAQNGKDVNAMSGDAAKDYAASLSTTDRPTEEDFKWLADAYYDGKDLEAVFDQNGATVVTNPEVLEGDWMACFRTKKGMDQSDNDSYRLFNVNIHSDGDSATMVFDWYFYSFGDGQSGNEEQYGDGTSHCKWNADHSGFESDDAGDLINMKKFIDLDGHQYAYGEYMYPSGEEEYLILQRPAGSLDTSHVEAGESRRAGSKAPSSKKLSNEEIAALCAKHCGAQYARIDSVNSDGTIVVQVYDEVDGHTTTYDWYTVNTETLETTTEFGFGFNLNDDR